MPVWVTLFWLVIALGAAAFTTIRWLRSRKANAEAKKDWQERVKGKKG